MKQTNMRMLALCAALCLCVATAAPAYAESTRQTPRTSFVETLLDIPVLGDILRFFSGEEPLSQAATAETATGETATPETSTPETAPTATPETATPTPAPTPGGSSTPESAATLPPTGTPQVYPAPDIVVMPTATPAITAAPQQEEENNTSDEPPADAATSAPAAATATQRPAAAMPHPTTKATLKDPTAAQAEATPMPTLEPTATPEPTEKPTPDPEQVQRQEQGRPNQQQTAAVCGGGHCRGVRRHCGSRADQPPAAEHPGTDPEAEGRKVCLPPQEGRQIMPVAPTNIPAQAAEAGDRI